MAAKRKAKPEPVPEPPPGKAHKIIQDIEWEGITIQVTYDPDWLNMSKNPKVRPTAHLELHVRDKERIPVTETGYRSHFLGCGIVEEHGGPEAYVKGWLDHEAKSREWQAWLKEKATPKQLDLFG